MIRNYLTTALRALTRDGSFAAINISGLAVGMAVCLLMLLFVRQHWLKDQFHSDPDQVHRITTVLPNGKHFAAAPPPVGDALAETGTGVDEIAQIWQYGGALLQRGPNRFEELFLFADPAFFEVFDGFQLAQGDKSQALDRPNQAVLSSAMADKLFGNSDPMGQTFTVRSVNLSEAREIKVAGVLEERPRDEPSHLSTDVILSSATVGADHEWVFANDWRTLSRNYAYVRLNETTAPADLQAQLNDLAETHYADDEDRFAFNLQPMSAIALNEADGPTWNSIYGAHTLDLFLAYVLIGLGVVVLFAAAFNYVNLTVARSLRRAKEVGVRKAIGAGRHQVAGQFLVESILLALAATGGAALLLTALVPAFKSLYSMRFLDPGLTFDPFAEPVLIVLLPAFGLIVGTVAGAYPAWTLSRPQPTNVLSGNPSSGSVWKGFWRVRLRKSLVGLQIVFALIVMVSTALLYQQSQTIRNASHGFETDQLFTVALEDVDYGAFRQQAQLVPGVKNVTGMKDIFMGGNHDFRALTRPGHTDTVEVEYFATDSTFSQVTEIKISASVPDLSDVYASGTAVILNEPAVSKLGFPTANAALGQDVKMGKKGPYRIAGIASGVWFDGRDAARIEPFALQFAPDQIRHALVHVANGQETRDVMASLEPTWASLDSAYSYAPTSYAEIKQGAYGPYQDLALLTGSAAFLALFIACLGLAALAAYIAQTRVKEIGIRKALGASEWSIVRRLTAGHAWVLAGAAAVGAPLAWIAGIRVWQPLFSQALAPSLPMVTGSILALGTVVLLVVGLQAWRAAIISPVEALRDE